MQTSDLRGKLSISIVSIVLLLVGLEGYARLVLHEKSEIERIQLNHKLGWEWTPGYAAIEYFHQVEYHLLISEQGLRDKEIDIPKPANAYRVLAIGDSITESPGVELEQSFVKQLERIIQNENSDLRIEVLNCGTGDYGLEQELIWLRERGLKFDPDLVILNIYLNDARGFNAPPPVVDDLVNFLSQNSAFYTYYQVQIRKLLLDREIKSPDFRFRYADSFNSENWKSDSEALTRLILEADQDWGMAWNEADISIIEKRLEEFTKLTDQHDIRFLVTVFPVSVQVYSEIKTPLGLTRPQEELVGYAKDNAIPTLDLLPVLKIHRDKDLYFDQAHLRIEGHRIVARAIYQSLIDFEMLPMQKE